MMDDAAAEEVTRGSLVGSRGLLVEWEEKAEEKEDTGACGCGGGAPEPPPPPLPHFREVVVAVSMDMRQLIVASVAEGGGGGLDKVSYDLTAMEEVFRGVDFPPGTAEGMELAPEPPSTPMSPGGATPGGATPGTPLRPGAVAGEEEAGSPAEVLGRRTLVVRGTGAGLDDPAWQVRVCFPSMREAGLWAALLSSLSPHGADGDSHESRMLKFEKARSARERGKLAAKARAELDNYHLYHREHVLTWAVNRRRKQHQLAAYMVWRGVIEQRNRVKRRLARCHERRAQKAKLAVFSAWALGSGSIPPDANRDSVDAVVDLVLDSVIDESTSAARALPPPSNGEGKSSDELLELLAGVLSGRYCTSLVRAAFCSWSEEAAKGRKTRWNGALLGRVLARQSRNADILAAYFRRWRDASEEQCKHRTLLSLWMGTPDPVRRSSVSPTATPTQGERSPLPPAPEVDVDEDYYYRRMPSPVQALTASPHARPPSRSPNSKDKAG